MKKLEIIKITVLFLLFLCLFSILIIGIKNIYVKYKQQEAEKNINEIIEESTKVEVNEETLKINTEIGFIVIPSINLKAPIKEGTTSEVLKYSVGHFTQTKVWDGNVALASHNRGSYAHYFSRINEMKKGKEIIYITAMGERRYKVTENKIIEETNVEILENTEENIITLITCVTGQRDKRQCIIGKEYESITERKCL